MALEVVDTEMRLHEQILFNLRVSVDISSLDINRNQNKRRCEE